MTALFRVREPTETSSAYENQTCAQRHAQEITAPPISRDTEADQHQLDNLQALESSDSKPSQYDLDEDHLGPSVSRAAEPSVEPNDIGLANIEYLASFKDQVIVQHICNADIQQAGSSALKDQGIAFDQTGQEYDMYDCEPRGHNCCA
jgi:hypothetical protein